MANRRYDSEPDPAPPGSGPGWPNFEGVDYGGGMWGTPFITESSGDDTAQNRLAHRGNPQSGFGQAPQLDNLHMSLIGYIKHLLTNGSR